MPSENQQPLPTLDGARVKIVNPRHHKEADGVIGKASFSGNTLGSGPDIPQAQPLYRIEAEQEYDNEKVQDKEFQESDLLAFPDS